MPAKKTHQITIPIRTLHRLVKPVLPCVETTGMLPSLNSVHVELRGAYLVASATDRFRLALCREPLAVDDDGNPAPAPKGVEFNATIRLGDVQHLLKLFPAGRHGEGAVTLTIDGDRLVAEAAGGLGLTFSDLRVSYQLHDGDFPDLDTIMQKAMAGDGDRLTRFAVNPDYIAAFKAAARDRYEALEVIAPTASNKPILCKVGDHFLGAIMPKNLLSRSETATDAPEWADFLRPAKDKEVAA